MEEGETGKPSSVGQGPHIRGSLPLQSHVAEGLDQGFSRPLGTFEFRLPVCVHPEPPRPREDVHVGHRAEPLQGQRQTLGPLSRLQPPSSLSTMKVDALGQTTSITFSKPHPKWEKLVRMNTPIKFYILCTLATPLCFPVPALPPQTLSPL